jgi:ATP-dependent RNA helicase RhlE
MEAEGDAFVLVSPAEERSLSRIERQIGQRLPRVTLPDFDYAQAAPAGAGRGDHRSGRRSSPPTRTGSKTPHANTAHPHHPERTADKGRPEESKSSRRRRRR